MVCPTGWELIEVKGVNYTEVFEDIHTDKFFYFFEIKRKEKIFLIWSIFTTIYFIVYVLIDRMVEINGFQLIFYLLYAVIALAIVIGVGMDYEDIPLYIFVLHVISNKKHVRIAGKNYYPITPYMIKSQIKYF